MATADEYAAWIVANSNRRGTPDFDTVVQAYEEAKAQEQAVPAVDQRTMPGATAESVAAQRREALISQIPGVDGRPVPPQPVYVPPTAGQRAVGIGEAALTGVTGVTGGTLGLIGGTLEGLAQSILSGEFGTDQARQLVERKAMERARQLTFAPRTQAGQEVVEFVGGVAEQLPPFVPVIGQAGTIAQSARMAAVPVEAAARRGAQVAAQAPAAVRQAVSEVPIIGTGGRVSTGAAATPEALRRQAIAEELGITLTRGAATRDPAQLAFEKEMMKNPSLGQPLRNRAEENNLQILQKFEELADQTGAAARSPSDTGNRVINALSSGWNQAKNKTRVQYRKARQSEGAKQAVDLNRKIEIEIDEQPTQISLIEYLNQQPSGIPATAMADTAKVYLQKLGLAEQDASGNLVPKQATVGQTEDFRQAMNASKGPNPADARQVKIIKDLIDATTEGLGGDEYAKARTLRQQQARKYESRAIVARLITNRRGMDDPKVAADQVFNQTILRGSPEEITFLKRVLQTSGQDGRDAFNELKAATFRYIENEATKGVGTDSMGRPLVSPAQLNKAINALDANGRLDVIFDKKTAQLLRDLNTMSKDISTVPPGTLVNPSGTAGTIIAAITEAGSYGLLAGLPVPVLTGLKEASKYVKNRETKARIRKALEPIKEE